MSDLNEKMEQAIKAAAANGGEVASGPTRAALIRRGLVYPMDHPDLAGRLTYEGERVANREADIRPDPDETEKPQELSMAPGELVYAATDPDLPLRYRFPGFHDWEAVPTTEAERLREVLVETLTVVELVLDERGYFQAPKRYIPIDTEDGQR